MKADTVEREPLRANVFTRSIYVTSLVGTIFVSWIALAMGMFAVLAALIVYRIYTVVRYRTALDARPPYLLGLLLRGIGWLLMAAGAAGMVSLFLVKPIALLLFKTPGDSGAVFFVIGLYATILAGAGPVGCAIFESSRLAGRKLPGPARPRDASARKQDLAVMGGVGLLAVLAMTLPSLLQLAKGPVSGRMIGGECFAPLVLDCAARIEPSASRVAAVPAGSAVRLRSNIEAIEYRHPRLKKGVVLLESIEDVLARAGHRVAADGDVLVDVEATGGATPVLVVRVADKAGEVARFTTTFARGAEAQTPKSGARRVVADVDHVILPPFNQPAAGGNVYFADGLYAQLRRALGSEREAAVFAAASTRTGTAGASTSPPTGYKYPHEVRVKNCAGMAGLRTRTAPEKSMPPFISALDEISFDATGATALLNHGEFVSCHDNSVWFVRHEDRAHLLHVRRYDGQGSLQRAWRVAMPQVPEVSRLPEPESLRESGGQVQLRMYVSEGYAYPKHQLIAFAFPI